MIAIKYAEFGTTSVQYMPSIFKNSVFKNYSLKSANIFLVQNFNLYAFIYIYIYKICIYIE